MCAPSRAQQASPVRKTDRTGRPTNAEAVKGLLILCSLREHFYMNPLQLSSGVRRRRQANDWTCGITDRGAKSPSVSNESVAFHPPDLALETLDVREHARRSVKLSIQSFGSAPRSRPPTLAGIPHPSRSVGRCLLAQPLRRPPNEALKLSGCLPSRVRGAAPVARLVF